MYLAFAPTMAALIVGTVASMVLSFLYNIIILVLSNIGVAVILGALVGSGVGIATDGFESVEALIPYALLGMVIGCFIHLLLRWMLGISSPVGGKSANSYNQGLTRKKRIAIAIKKVLLITVIIAMWGGLAARRLWQIRITDVELNAQAITVVSMLIILGTLLGRVGREAVKGVCLGFALCGATFVLLTDFNMTTPGSFYAEPFWSILAELSLATWGLVLVINKD
ncbi:MAG: hypothetical protein DRI81_14990 [Chloroflexi bacterium]|nr:MAG: hypothetical protein DRI81_14990 [Chloroflexota bacterium]